eukprot:s6_g13.t1
MAKSDNAQLEHAGPPLISGDFPYVDSPEGKQMHKISDLPVFKKALTGTCRESRLAPLAGSLRMQMERLSWLKYQNLHFYRI